MSSMRKRATETDKKKTYRGADRVTVLGLVCEKMTDRVVRSRQEEEDRRVRQEKLNMLGLISLISGLVLLKYASISGHYHRLQYLTLMLSCSA
jgi:hypothetical protein